MCHEQWCAIRIFQLTCRIETRRTFYNHFCLHYFSMIWKKLPAQKWNILTFIDRLYNDSNDGINGMLNLFVLLYADDTVIMAENEHDMQRNLDLLNEYCICNKLKINIIKTK